MLYSLVWKSGTIYMGIEGFKSSDSYLARYSCDERNLVLEDIPDGSLVCIN